MVIGPVDSPGQADFAIGTLVVAANANVTFQDVFDNDLGGQLPCTEAQYVGTLTLEPNANVTFDNCRVYYQTLNQDPTATLTHPRLRAGAAGGQSSCADARAGRSHQGPVRGRGRPPLDGRQETALRVRLTKLNHPRFCCVDATGTSCSATTCDLAAHCAAVPGGNQTCAHQAAAGSPDFSAIEGGVRYVNSFAFPTPGGSLNCADDGRRSTRLTNVRPWAVTRNTATGLPTWPTRVRVNRPFPDCCSSPVTCSRPVPL